MLQSKGSQRVTHDSATGQQQGQDRASLLVLVVKNSPANVGNVRDTGSNSGWEDSVKKEMAIHSIILVWEILWMEEPAGLKSIGLQRVAYH